MDLESIGFEASEIFQCELQGPRILVPVLVAGKPTQLLLDTGAADEIILSLDYVREQKFPFHSRGLFPSSLKGDAPREVGSAVVPEIAALGRIFSPDDVAVKDFQPGIIHRPAVGLIGAEYFKDGILGVDPRRGQVAFSSRSTFQGHSRAAVFQLRTIPLGHGCVPVTHDIQDGLTRRTTSAVLLLDTGAEDSYLMLDYIQREHGIFLRWLSRWVHRMGYPVNWHYQVSDDFAVRLRTWLQTSLSPYAERRGIPHIDGVLGMNFLAQWITIYDFVNAQVELIEY